ncbi:hypothetical protein KUV57_13335 [Epibacterium sp. DP7N7-1]|nr:hypothetical protein [Epibacterium sp. DP7N7-1]
MHIPWTQLEGTVLWDDSKRRHESDVWRRYHAFSHPVFLYTQAEAFGYPYCRSLDRAILTHDVISSGVNPEKRCVEWLENRLEKPDFVARKLILSTVTHTPCSDNRLIILDLSSFMVDELRRSGSEAFFQEKAIHQGWDLPTFIKKNTEYLVGLSQRISDGMYSPIVPLEDQDQFSAIREGIMRTLHEFEQFTPDWS